MSPSSTADQGGADFQYLRPGNAPKRWASSVEFYYASLAQLYSGKTGRRIKAGNRRASNRPPLAIDGFCAYGASVRVRRRQNNKVLCLAKHRQWSLPLTDLRLTLNASLGWHEGPDG